MSRFTEAPQQVTDQMNTIIGQHFPELNNALIMVLMDTKKRTAGGRHVLGRFKKTNDESRILSATNSAPDGVDYIMFLDEAVYNAIDEADQVRIIRHELRHSEVDHEATNPFKIRDHEITDFYDEIELNKTDPRWMERVGVIAEAVYDPDREPEEE